MMELMKSGGFSMYLELGLTAHADRLDGVGAKLRYLIGILLEPRASFMDMQFLYSGLGPGLTGPCAWSVLC